MAASWWIGLQVEHRPLPTTALGWPRGRRPLASWAACLSALLLSTRIAGSASPNAAPGCYTAEVAQWTWCHGYAAAGYTCAADGSFCSSATCVGECGQCADFYSGAQLDAASARCCAALAPGGGCAGAPLPGDAPYNPPYGFPNNGPGALIVEGPVASAFGPTVWSNSSEGGAYAFVMLAQSGKKDAECAPPPAGGAWQPPAGLRPVSLFDHGEKIADCALGCNVSEVARTGRDPCNAASIFNNSAAPSLAGVYANYSCYYGGESWLRPAGLGLCGFNCSALQSDGALCSEADLDDGRCLVYCDSRTLPPHGGRGAAAAGGRPARRLRRGAVVVLEAGR